MTNVIQRDPDEEASLYAWNYVALGHGAVVDCGPEEVLVCCSNDEHAIATLGPGRVALTPEAFPALAKNLERHFFSDGPKVTVVFVTTRPVVGQPIEVACGQTLDTDARVDEVVARASVTYVVGNPGRFAEQVCREEDGDDPFVSESDLAPEDDADAPSAAPDADDEQSLEEHPRPPGFRASRFAARLLRWGLREVVRAALSERGDRQIPLTPLVIEHLAERMSAKLAPVGLRVVRADELLLLLRGERLE